MPDETPAIRAHYSKLALKRLRAYPEGKGSGIRERVGSERLAAIRDAASLDWLPVPTIIALCDAILEVLGEAEARRFWTDLMRDSYDHGILKPLTMLAGFRLGKSAVAGLVKTAPRAWQLSSQACGSLEVLDDPAGVKLRSHDLVPEILHSRGFLCVFYGACQAMLDVLKSRAKLEIYAHEVDGQPQLGFSFQLDP
ncbi:hypothetical protein [Nannocystis bainbridge]|uniref:DUF2378 family protein n=1 Tax=Nannocystis bainbridge TaxID=2995303 RepID=A0ABT5E2U2_9BACT|nr:hypothetical protein [Nannocystis bainbridge]MDC0720075.1 hypothetical protein [Nannocystis bainbridge]